MPPTKVVRIHLATTRAKLYLEEILAEVVEDLRGQVQRLGDRFGRMSGATSMAPMITATLPTTTWLRSRSARAS